MPAVACPGSEQLWKCAIGALQEEQAAGVLEHVERCKSCQVAFDAFLGQGDRLLDHLHGLPAAPLVAFTSDDERFLKKMDAKCVTLPLARPTPHPDDTLAGEVELPSVPGYEVIEEIGRGGMGIVYKARHLALNRLVALKMVLAAELASPEQLVRFRYEAELAAQVHHPNVVHVYEVGYWRGQPYLAMEWIDGGSLAAKMRGQLHPPRDAAGLIEVLARAVHAAHIQGVIHRDLKPANILLVSGGVVSGEWSKGTAHHSPLTTHHSPLTPKIVDFGLAKSTRADAGLTNTGAVLGTPEYMAPEQARGNQHVGAPADVYGLGAILYEMLTGRPPIRCATTLETLQQLLEQPPVSIHRLRADVPRDLETICHKCLEKIPGRRYASAEALADDLKRFLAGEPIHARRVGEMERLWLWTRRRPGIAALLLGLVSALLAGITVSTYFAVESGNRATLAQTNENEANSEREKARISEAGAISERQKAQTSESRAIEARHAADLQAAQLTFAAGLAQAEAGEVARGMYTFLDAWRMAPADAIDLRRLIRLNLAAWSRQVPVLERVMILPADKGWMTASAGFVANSACSAWIVGPNDSMLVTFRGGLLRRWNTVTAQPLGPAVVLPGMATPMDVSSDGLCYITMGPGDANSGFAFIHDARTGKQIGERFRHVDADGRPARLTRAHFALGGRIVVTCSQDDRLPTTSRSFWHTRTGKRILPGVRFRHGDNYRLLAGPGGQDLLVVFRYANPADPSRVPSHSEQMRLSRSPVSVPPDRAEFWELGSGKRLDTLPAGLTGDARVSSDGQSIVSIQGDSSLLFDLQRCDGLLQWWSTRDGKPLAESWRPRREARVSRVSRDGMTLLGLCDDQRIRLYDLDSGLQRGGNIPGAGMNYLFVDRDRGMLAADQGADRVLTTATDGTVRFWRTAGCLPQPSAAASPRAARSRTRMPLLGFHSNNDASSSVAFSPDGRTVLVCRGDEYGRLTDVATGQPVGRPLRGDLTFPVFAPNGERVVTAAYSTTTGQVPWVRLWHPQSGQPAAVVQSPKFVYAAPVFSPDSKTVTVAGPGLTGLLDVATGRFRHVLSQPDVPSCTAFSPDSRRVAVGYRWGDTGAGLRLWDTTTGKPLDRFWPTNPCRGLQFRDGGRVLIVLTQTQRFTNDPSETRVQLHDGQTGKPMRQPFSLGEAGPIALSADGRQVAVSYMTQSVQQWDISAGRAVGTSMAQPAAVTRMCYSPDRRMLAIAAQDQSVRLWDATACQPVGPPLMHRTPTLDLSFTSDGRHLLTVTQTGFTHAWPVYEPVADDRERMAGWLAVTSGVVPTGTGVALLDAQAWSKRQVESERRWPAADPALAHLKNDEAIDEARLRQAEEEGDDRAQRIYLDRLLARRPGDWLLHARKGAVAVRAGAHELARACYNQAAHAGGARQREALENWYRHQAVAAGLLEQSASELWYQDRLIASRPADGSLYLERSRTHGRMEQLALRLADLERACKHASDTGLLRELAAEYAGLGDWPRTAGLYDRINSLPGRALDDFFNHGLACLKAGRKVGYRKTCARVTRALAAGGKNIPPNAAAAAALLWSLGPDAVADWKEPLELIESAVKQYTQIESRLSDKQRKDLAPVRHVYLRAWGLVLYRANRFKDAIGRLEEGIAGENSAGVHDWAFLAMAHHRLNQHDQAQQCLQRARQARSAQKPANAWQHAEMDLPLEEAIALIGPAKAP